MKNKTWILIALNFLLGCEKSPPLKDSSFEYKKVEVEKKTDYCWIFWPSAQKNLTPQEEESFRTFFLSKVAPGCHIRFSSRFLLPERSVIIKKLLKDIGFKNHQIAVDPFIPEVTEIIPAQYRQVANNPDFFGIALDHYGVIVPRCGNWSSPLGDADSTRSYSNFSCSTMQNLALMIADPKDLVKPLHSSQTNGEYAQHVIEKYKEGASKSSAGSSKSSPSGSSGSSSSAGGGSSGK